MAEPRRRPLQAHTGTSVNISSTTPTTNPQSTRHRKSRTTTSNGPYGYRKDDDHQSHKYSSHRKSAHGNESSSHSSRTICLQVTIAVLLIIIILYMMVNDQHIPMPHLSKSNTKDVTINNVEITLDTSANASSSDGIRRQPMLIADEELLKHDHITSARIVNPIPPSLLRSHVSGTKDDVHIVFSSGCTEYQNWQSEVLLYSWAKLRHPGSITRLVSGCKDLEERKRALKTAIVSERVFYFFAPDYTPPNSGGHNPFHYFNKPYTMDKWLHEVEIAESFIVLIDPDMIITKVFDFHMPFEEGSYSDRNQQIRKGNPVSQKYGIGAKWVPWGLCQTEVCRQVNDRIAWDHYSVGPPYMMHVDDWKLISPKWVEYSPDALKHDPPPSILAEMYSYAIACAHYDLKHTYIYSMLSDPGADRSEPGWKDISLDFYANNKNHMMNTHILHYCHGYWLGKDRPSGHFTNNGFNFHKGHLPKDILHNCDIPLLVEPPTNEIALAKDPSKGKYHLWMLYHIITRINDALANYKHIYCPNWVPQFKTVLRQPELDPKRRMHYFLD